MSGWDFRCRRINCPPGHLCLGLHVRGTRDPRMTSPVTGPRVSFSKMVTTAVEYDHVYNFLQLHCYPPECNKNKKRSLRRKANEHYKIKSGTLVYSAMSATKANEKKGCFSGREWKRVIKNEDERLRIFTSCHSSTQGK